MTKILLGLALSFLLSVGSAHAHLSQGLLTCPVFSEVQMTHPLKYLRDGPSQTAGLHSELYDINNDGVADIATYSAVMGGFDEKGNVFHKTAPIFYEIDEDGDGSPDKLYIDRLGEERCEDLVIYSEEDDGGLASWSEPEMFVKN